VQRGEVWRYDAKGPRGDRLVVIVSGSGINADDRRPWLIGIEVVDQDPGDLLAVPLPEGTWADASTLVRVFRRWLVEPIETLDAATVERIDVALRAALDL
jgi:mRNA-degrading endonuclease toxin of MazEF toxin-antitoxin module